MTHDTQASDATPDAAGVASEKRISRGVDTRVYDLAALFLSDVASATPRDREELALLLQDTIEAYRGVLEEAA